MNKLITFLNTQEFYIKDFTFLHIGFFESDKGVSFYVTGSPTGIPSGDEHTSFELFPLAPVRYWSLDGIKDAGKDPFGFIKKIREELKNAVEKSELADTYKNAQLITFGWDDGDLEYLKGDPLSSK